MTNQTLHSLTVKWDAPEVGGVTGYNVTLVGESTFHTQTVGKDATVTFTGLKAGAECIVGVAAVSGNQRSTNVEGKFYTCKYASCNYFGPHPIDILFIYSIRHT